MTRKKVFFALAVAFMVVVMVVGFILENSVSPVVTRLFGTLVDKPPEETVATTNDAARQLASEVEAQGAVLLANNGTLPLSSDVTKVNVFGWASVDWLGGGSGSGCVTSSRR
jgi:beta-glucosidase